MIKRTGYHILLKRLKEPRQFIQALVGPRQVGKTTLALQVLDATKMPSHYASADDSEIHSFSWLEQQWEVGRSLISSNKSAVLVIDEIQKIKEWSSMVKRLWDEDTRKKRPLKVILLGSAPLMIQHGLSESLAGRFETIPIRHWTFEEMHSAFKWDFDQYVYFGGYPGAASFIKDETRWKHYVANSLIETTISKDIFSLSTIQKPALLKQLFHLGCLYSGQIVSYQKITGQLQDAGNTTTLAHYLGLLSTAGLLSGLSKYAGQTIRQRGSSPKFQVQNTALLSALSSYSFIEAKKNRDYWGRLLESSIGAYLINETTGKDIQVFYWREGHFEVDFVLKMGKKLIAIEVKSGKIKEALPGMDAFQKQFKPQRILLISEQGIKPERFLRTPVEKWFNE
ncbi:MAG: ATP-binding protein [Gammaproteobacteria bacterium]|nr:ATP-binding protein [Gammaproteobacteria bacterium]